MSLSSIFNVGVSGLMTAQQRLSVASDNISNINTEGYVRKVAPQESLVTAGRGTGVRVSEIQLVTDRFLQGLSLGATSDQSYAQNRFEALDQVQAQFGDLTSNQNLFSLAGNLSSDFLEIAENPSSNALRQQVLGRVSDFLDETKRLSENIQSARGSADQRIEDTIGLINSHLSDIATLNDKISSARVQGADLTGIQNQQLSLIDKLAQLIDVEVKMNENGASTLKTKAGLQLVTLNGASSFAYEAVRDVTATSSFKPISLITSDKVSQDVNAGLTAGELKALIDVRDKDLPDISAQIAEYAHGVTEAINAAHNLASPAPAPSSVTGQALALTQSEAISGFQGKTEIVTLTTGGVIANRLLIDFDTNQMSLNGGASVSFSDGTFASDLTAASGGALSANFTGGVMSLSASGGINAGIAVVETNSNASSNQGRAFSHYFGLNNLIDTGTSHAITTGLSPSSNHGFGAGELIKFQLTNAKGAQLAKIEFSIPSASSMTDLLSALNNTLTGVGRYGTFGLDPVTGQMSFAGFGVPSNSLSISEDNSRRLGTDVSLSQFFGLSGTRTDAVRSFSLKSAIETDTSKLSLARVNANALAGERALVSANSDGADLLASIKDIKINFQKTGSHPGGLSRLETYGGDLAGMVGQKAASAKRAQDNAEIIKLEAKNRRASVEGVNLDEELVNLTTFQQAYSASGRVIQAAKEMFDVLLNM